VPGIPEANIQVLERLRESLQGKGPVKIKEQGGDVTCVFCGNPADYLVSVCQSCFDKLAPTASEGFEPLVAGEYVLGFYQDPALFLPEHFRLVWLDQTNRILGVVSLTRADVSKELYQSILFGLPMWQPNMIQDWLQNHQSYLVPASSSASPNAPTGFGVESLKEEELKKLVEDGVKEGLKKAGIVEAEWDTAYINNLSDEAFAYIVPGGQKDDQGKTVPRSLRNLPYKNAEGSLDADHVRNALARLDQTNISAEGKTEATKKLCAAAKELNIASAVCGLTNQTEALRKELSDTTTKLTEAEKQIKELKEKQGMQEALAAKENTFRKEILECIPEESIIRSWKAPGAVLTIRKIQYKLAGNA
jgi:hypothetical protein